MRHFKYPPPLNDDFKPFKEDLKPIIEAKLQECLDRQNELLKEYEFATFSEYYIIHKWIAYWLNLYGKITDQKKNVYKYARFEQFEIDRAKEYPFEQLVGVEFKKTGNKWFAKCPFHEENTPSFCIFPNNQAKCFAGCGWGGDTSKYGMETKGVKCYEASREGVGGIL